MVMFLPDYTHSTLPQPDGATTVIARTQATSRDYAPGFYGREGTGFVDVDSKRVGSTSHEVKGRFDVPEREFVSTAPAAAAVAPETAAWVESLKKGKEARSAASQASAKPAERILRAHYASDILEDLQRLAEHSRETTSAVYANAILDNVRHLRDLTPEDSFVEILMAFHDALAFNNKWAEFDGEQYLAAHRILKANVNSDLSSQKIRKVILKLEEAGFNTTPFSVDIDFFQDRSVVDEQEG